MARAPLIQLSEISLTFGGHPIFSDLGFVVQTGDRISLVAQWFRQIYFDEGYGRLS